MDFNELISKTFSENEIYELILFEVESNLKNYLSKFTHIYFDRIDSQSIVAKEVVYFEDVWAMSKVEREIVDKKEWIQVYDNYGHIDLMFCRLDRTGRISVVRRDQTIHQVMNRFCWADEYPEYQNLSPEEIRKGFEELAKAFSSQIELQDLKSKKAV